MYIRRSLHQELVECLDSFPAVAVLGPRRCGKSTMARAVMGDRRDGLYLDLERPSDLAKLSEPELFLESNAGKLVCLDEIQRAPELFRVLRALIDENPRPGRFLILGSASPELLRQSSETLAGRIAFLDLTLFQYAELQERNIDLRSYHLLGGFLESILPSQEGGLGVSAGELPVLVGERLVDGAPFRRVLFLLLGPAELVDHLRGAAGG